jgi:hypothetical protein
VQQVGHHRRQLGVGDVGRAELLAVGHDPSLRAVELK